MIWRNLLEGFLDGIVVNEETIAYEVIKKVGQNEHYLMEDHTLRHIKPEERTDYKIFNRVVPETWEQQGKPSIMDNARKLAYKIITDHRVKQLDKNVKVKIRKIIQTFEDALDD